LYVDLSGNRPDNVDDISLNVNGFDSSRIFFLTSAEAAAAAHQDAKENASPGKIPLASVSEYI